MPSSSLRLALLATALLSVPAAAARAQDRLQAARVLYANADYEQALALLSAADASEAPDAATWEAHHYRALCLVALGRVDEAERAMADAIEANPRFVPAAADVSPRVLSLFSEVRHRLLPQIVRRHLTAARRLSEDGGHDRAAAAFAGVMTLLEDPALASREDLDDLRLAATTLRDLARARAEAARATEPSPAAAPPQPMVRAPEFTRPVAIAQALPRWNRSGELARWGFAGAVRVTIDESGAVTGAAIERSVHPAYDRLVLEAARGWRYRPATRDGRPTVSETVVAITVAPQAPN
jgi:protein TonB